MYYVAVKDDFVQLVESRDVTHDSNTYYLATLENVTIELIVSAIDDALGNANFNSQIGIGQWLGEILCKQLGYQKAKEVLWVMINEKGLLWEFN